LGDDGQIDAVGAQRAERAEQAVDVSADTTPVRGDGRGVDEHSGRATGGHRATPQQFRHRIGRYRDPTTVTPVAQATGKSTPVAACRAARDAGRGALCLTFSRIVRHAAARPRNVTTAPIRYRRRR
jgi:hypothetical protein